MTPPILNPGTDLPFPQSLPDVQRMFPDDAACAKYLEGIRWPSGFVEEPGPCRHGRPEGACAE